VSRRPIRCRICLKELFVQVGPGRLNHPEPGFWIYNDRHEGKDWVVCSVECPECLDTFERRDRGHFDKWDPDEIQEWLTRFQEAYEGEL